MSQPLPVTVSPEVAFIDEAAEHLQDLVDRAERGDRWVRFPIRLILALTPGLWDRHALLAMRAERACLMVTGGRLLDGLRRLRPIVGTVDE